MNMNIEQILGIVRSFLQIAGTYLVSSGLLTGTDWTTVSGAVLMVVPVVWGLYAHTDANAVAAVGRQAADPDSPVKGVIVTPTVSGLQMANAVTTGVTVAGTPRATDMARN